MCVDVIFYLQCTTKSLHIFRWSDHFPPQYSVAKNITNEQMNSRNDNARRCRRSSMITKKRFFRLNWYNSEIIWTQGRRRFIECVLHHMIATVVQLHKLSHTYGTFRQGIFITLERCTANSTKMNILSRMIDESLYDILAAIAPDENSPWIRPICDAVRLSTNPFENITSGTTRKIIRWKNYCEPMYFKHATHKIAHTHFAPK